MKILLISIISIIIISLFYFGLYLPNLARTDNGIKRCSSQNLLANVEFCNDPYNNPNYDNLAVWDEACILSKGIIDNQIHDTKTTKGNYSTEGLMLFGFKGMLIGSTMKKPKQKIIEYQKTCTIDGSIIFTKLYH